MKCSSDPTLYTKQSVKNFSINQYVSARTLAISIDEANAKLFSYPEIRINCPDMFSTDPCVSTFH